MLSGRRHWQAVEKQNAISLAAITHYPLHLQFHASFWKSIHYVLICLTAEVWLLVDFGFFNSFLAGPMAQIQCLMQSTSWSWQAGGGKNSLQNVRMKLKVDCEVKLLCQHAGQKLIKRVSLTLKLNKKIKPLVMWTRKGWKYLFFKFLMFKPCPE